MTGVLLGMVLMVAQAAPGQVAPPLEACLHGPQETLAERARRADAVAAMRMIDWVMQQHEIHRLHDVWVVMGNLSAVAALKGGQGRLGELARAIAWGAEEPLPGWRLMLSTARSMSAYALTDTRDPCALRLASTDPDVVPPRPHRILPLDGY